MCDFVKKAVRQNRIFRVTQNGKASRYPTVSAGIDAMDWELVYVSTSGVGNLLLGHPT